MKKCQNKPAAALWAVLPVAAALLAGLYGCTISGMEEETPDKAKTLAIMTWNVHNFFDGTETGYEYDEFRESSGWSMEKYSGRLNVVSDAIDRIEPAPDIIAVQELENVQILADLTASLPGYTHAHFANNSDGSLGLGIISRFPLLGTRAHSVSIDGVTAPRPVLETRIEAEGRELALFVCHWKSKIGDDDGTEEARMASARVILRRIRELLKQEPELPVIIMGDLNENYDEFFRLDGTTICALLPDDPGCAELAGQYSDERGDSSQIQMDFLIVSEDKPPVAHYFPQGVLAFYSPWTGELKNGSYYYKGNWETIDHFLISDQLFNNSGWEYENCVVIDYPPFTNSGGHPAAYSPKTGKGLSDHLPLLLTLKMRD